MTCVHKQQFPSHTCDGNEFLPSDDILFMVHDNGSDIS